MPYILGLVLLLWWMLSSEIMQTCWGTPDAHVWSALSIIIMLLGIILGMLIRMQKKSE